MLERQVRYNFKTTTGEQEPTRHRWTFMIINEPREIRRIRERIYFELQPIADLKELGTGNILFVGLHYDFFSFSSSTSQINPPKIYDSKKFKKDRDLTERDELGMLTYLTSIIQGRK
jgi:hypothetical protein